MSYYPQTEESADNTSAVTFELGDRATRKFQATIEITTGTALAGTVAISVQPFVNSGSSLDPAFITFATTIDCTDPSVFEFDGKYQAVRFTPTSLSAGAKFTAILDSLEK